MNKYFSIFIISVLIPLFAQTTSDFYTKWSQDTVNVVKGDSIIFLSHQFVVKNSESIVSEGTLIRNYELNSINGKITLESHTKKDQVFIINYEYLVNPFQTRFGPPLSILPRLDDILNHQDIMKENIKSTLLEEADEMPIVADGSIFRGISISPFGGMSLNGGLRLSLQGQLSDDVAVTGTLTDQNSPIQPEGNTQTLDELDKVYLEVNHPSAKIIAGDIDMKLNQGRFFSINRRLEGLNIAVWNNTTKIEGYLAGTKGRYHQVSFIGEEQNQGPYTLLSENGSRNIIVMAGSERVWVDGKRMERGENNDYTIDYSRGEITFTPYYVIHDKSRIYIEYEYSDLVFPKEITSLQTTRTFKDEKLFFSLGWLRENDKIDSKLMFGPTENEREFVKLAGDDEKNARIFTVYEDSSGNYEFQPNPNYFEDSILVYIPDEKKISGMRYYRATFHNVGSQGEYARKISQSGHIYFEYVQELDRDSHSDLYVPWKTVTLPKTHDLLNFTTKFFLTDSTILNIELTGTRLDKNRLSRLDDKDNNGLASSIQFVHNQKIGNKYGVFGIAITNLQLNQQFSPLQRDREVEFHREWNLITNKESIDDGNRERLNEVKAEYRLGRQKSSISFGNYSDEIQTATRWRGKTDLSFNWIPSMDIDLTFVKRENASKDSLSNKNTSWRRQRFQTILLPGTYHPYIDYEAEEKTADFKFQEMSGGLKYEGRQVQTKIGLTRRLDFEDISSEDEWSRISDGLLGEVDFRGKWRSGYRLNFLFKQRIKTYFDQRDNIHFSLARGTFGYTPRHRLLRTSIDFKLEQTLFARKIAVYDSVGPGMGNYRYDQDYDQYFPDPNGDYILFLIPSGERTPASHLTTGLRFSLDLRKKNVPFLKHTLWKMYMNTDFNGKTLSTISILRPTINMENVNRSRISVQQEINYLPRHSRRRGRFATTYRRELNQQYVQSTDEKNVFSTTLKIEEPLNQQWIFVGEGSTQNHQIKSKQYLRERSIKGWNTATGLRWKPSNQIEVGGDLRTGEDRGKNSYESFKAQMFGIGVHSILFIKRSGRVQTSLDSYTVSTPKSMTTFLPPEAAQGLQVGNTIRASMIGIISLGENLSATINLSYTKDPLHDQLFSLNGEVRATF